MKKTQPNLLLFITLITLNTVSFMATNIYVPAMPAISLEFGVPILWVQNSLTIYMVPFAILPMIVGPLADRANRRTLILFSLVLTLLGSALILMGGLRGLLLGRFIQGGALGLITISARALIADCCKGKEQAQYYSWIQCFSPFISLSSPLLGGLIHRFFGWKGIFIFFVIYCLALWGLSCKSLPKKSLQSQWEFESLSYEAYLKLFQLKPFMRFAFFPALMMIGQSGFVCLSPFIFERSYDLTPAQYGWCTVPIYAGLILSALINIRLLNKICVQKAMILGAGFMLLSVVLLMFNVVGHGGLTCLILACMGYFISNSFLVTNAYALASESTQGRQSCAFALMSFIKISAGIVTTFVSSWFAPDESTLLILFSLASLGVILALLCSHWNSIKQTKKQNSFVQPHRLSNSLSS